MSRAMSFPKDQRDIRAVIITDSAVALLLLFTVLYGPIETRSGRPWERPLASGILRQDVQALFVTDSTKSTLLRLAELYSRAQTRTIE